MTASSQGNTRRHTASLATVAVWLLALLLPLLALLRALEVQASYGAVADCGACMAWAAVGSDAWLLASAWLLLAIAAALRHAPWLRALLVLPVLALALLMALDLALLATLNTRLYLFDVLKFGGEWSATARFVQALLQSDAALLALLLAAAWLAALPALGPARRSLARALLFGAGALLAAAVALAGGGPAYVHAEGYMNLVALHRAQQLNQPYSDAFRSQLASAPELPAVHCGAGQSRRPDIVLLVVESLSSYQSALLGGPLAMTPRLDALAREHRYFTRFHANGFTTDHGLIALLTGRWPVPAINRYTSLGAFAGFDDPARSVGGVLHPQGYQLAFFTTGDLGFLDKAPWLSALGFDHVEGAEAPFYDGWPRGAFNAAEDRALYQRVLQWLDQRSADGSDAPLFATLLTVESHPPMVERSTGRSSEAAVMARVDAAAADFAGALSARGFFARGGLLLVTGDHRAMTALHAQEIAAHGSAAFARVPLIVVGGPPGPAVVEAPFQQTDLLPSLAQLTGAQACRHPGQGWLLAQPPQPPDWVLHVRGDQRSRLDLHHAGGSATLLLAGDDSRWTGTPPADAAAIAAAIHRDRIARGALDSDVPALLRLLAPE